MPYLIVKKPRLSARLTRTIASRSSRAVRTKVGKTIVRHVRVVPKSNGAVVTASIRAGIPPVHRIVRRASSVLRAQVPRPASVPRAVQKSVGQVHVPAKIETGLRKAGLSRSFINMVAKRRAHDTAKRDRIAQANIQATAQGLLMSGPPLSTDNLQWPPEITHAFAISIRNERWGGMQARLGAWRSHVKLWPGTHGHQVHPRMFLAQKKVNRIGHLGSGQLGCWDSHMRLWQHIVQHKLPVTLILEDDANLRYDNNHAKIMRDMFDEIKKLNVDWELCYLGRGQERHSRKIGSMLSVPRGCSGLFGYIITEECARKLLQTAIPWNQAVDVYVANQIDAGKIKGIGLLKSMFYVCKVYSDTVH